MKIVKSKVKKNTPKSRFSKLDFSHVSREKRKKVLKQDKDVEIFLSHMPGKERKVLEKMFLAGKIDTENKKIITNWMLDNSELFRKVSDRPSDERIFRLLYRLRVPMGIDRYYVDSLAGAQIFWRLKSMEENMPGLVKELEKRFLAKRIKAVNFFSGLALEWFKIFKKNQEFKERLIVHNIDNDPLVCEKGAKISKEKNLEKSVIFRHEDIRVKKPASYHIAVLVGVLCPLPEKIQNRLLQVMHLYVKQNGLLVVSVPTPTMVKEDPFTDMLMRISGWNMYYKTAEEISHLGLKNGWKEYKIFFDNKGYHCVMAFTPLRNWTEKLKRKAIITLKNLKF